MRATRLVMLFILLLPVAAYAEGPGLGSYLRSSGTAIGQQHFVGPLRVPSRLGQLLARFKITAGLTRNRPIIQVTNESLQQYVQSTAKGYLEVVIPASQGKKGHVFFRHGEEVFDFYPGGFRVGQVRPIKGERYGMLVPLTPEQDKNLGQYLQRLKSSDGQELGPYDFNGEKGFHCVSWIMRTALNSQGENLAQLLGQKSGEAGGIVRFSRFMLKRAKGVEAVTVYRDEPASAGQLSQIKFDFITNRQLERAFAEESFH